MGKVITLVVILAILGLSVFAAYAWIKDKQSDETGLELIEATTGSITEKALAIGQIEPRHKFHIKSKISGIVRRVHVEIGDAVKPGDPLFEIEPDPTPAELVTAERVLESAQSAHAHAKAELARKSRLADQGILSRDELDAQTQRTEQARIALERARDALELTREGRIAERAELESIIRAPAGGIVLARHVDVGDPVVPLTSYQAGTELSTLADMSDLVFKGTVDEIDVGKLVLSMPARLKVGALPDEVVTGRLVRIAPQATEKDGAKVFELEIELAPTGGITLRAGYSATVDLILREKTDITVLPERLVTFNDDGSEAWVELPPRTPEAEPEKQVVKVGLSDGLNIEIVEGLESGDKVVQRPPREIGS